MKCVLLILVHLLISSFIASYSSGFIIRATIAILPTKPCAFCPNYDEIRTRRRKGMALKGNEEDQTSPLFNVKSINTMTSKQIQSELISLGISYKDCFDKESLLQRLRDAQGCDASIDNSNTSAQTKDEEEKQGQVQEPIQKQHDTSSTTDTGIANEINNTTLLFDKPAIKAELRKLRVSELRAKLGEQGIRWANMIEKEDLVNALASNMEAMQAFSKSKTLIPGKVNEVTDDTLSIELEENSSSYSSSDTPLLLDVYATWCGPCTLVAPQLEAASKELSNSVRFVKIDSDKYPQWSSKLKIGAFPTLILFSSKGEEIKRIEGALVKDQIIDFVKQNAF